MSGGEWWADYCCRWDELFVAGVCGVVHYAWLVKADLAGPAAYGAVPTLLLLLRLPGRAQRPAMR